MPAAKEMKCNIAATLEKSAANGPGKRYVIWFQGCHFHCPGCCNPDYQPFVEKTLVSPDVLAERILTVGGIDGVTYTGGEPLIQAEAVHRLGTILKENGLSIVCYTGFTLEELQQEKNPYITKLLNLIDILLDGRYEQEQRANLLWRGSRNKRVRFLTDRYISYRPLIEQGKAEMELVVGASGMVMTGILQERIVPRLERLLRRSIC